MLPIEEAYQFVGSVFSNIGVNVNEPIELRGVHRLEKDRFPNPVVSASYLGVPIGITVIHRNEKFWDVSWKHETRWIGGEVIQSERQTVVSKHFHPAVRFAILRYVERVVDYHHNLQAKWLRQAIKLSSGELRRHV